MAVLSSSMDSINQGVEGAFVIDVCKNQILKPRKIRRNYIVRNRFKKDREDAFVGLYSPFDLK